MGKFPMSHTFASVSWSSKADDIIQLLLPAREDSKFPAATSCPSQTPPDGQAPFATLSYCYIEHYVCPFTVYMCTW